MTVMTTTGGAPATTGGATAGYTHRHWKLQMVAAMKVLLLIIQALEVMQADLARVDAGRTHRAEIAELVQTFTELIQEGARIIGVEDAIAIPLADAIAKAGGLAEVATKKEYHQR
jgi:hypothetical protein